MKNKQRLCLKIKQNFAALTVLAATKRWM